jgi:hypothetical protein|mmetsp:Transcript_12283/g.26833  ORF Transcript_12283/g.26833 Transcript_12283/m.26833 type:complete len:84 (+) Transcript_12283:211-462(+)
MLSLKSYGIDAALAKCLIDSSESNSEVDAGSVSSLTRTVASNDDGASTISTDEEKGNQCDLCTGLKAFDDAHIHDWSDGWPYD